MGKQNNSSGFKLDYKKIISLLVAVLVIYLLVSGRFSSGNSGDGKGDTAEASLPLVTQSQTQAGIVDPTSNATTVNHPSGGTGPAATPAETTEAPTTATSTTLAETTKASTQAAATTPAETTKVYKNYTFRNSKLLNEHYDKHGKEMGFKSAKDYEKAACDVINNPAALYKTEKEDGDHVYYIESSNEFVVLSKDGYIRTYFLPSAGKAYFDRQ